MRETLANSTSSYSSDNTTSQPAESAHLASLQGATLSSQSATMTKAERDQLVISHMSTVKIIARQIHERLPQHIDFEELTSAGVIGLLDAVQKFSFDKKIQFKSYAQFRIRGAILDSLRETDWSPRELRRKGRAVEEVIRVLTPGLGRAPNDEEIAKELDLGLAEYQQLLGSLKGLEIGSLNLERPGEFGEEELSYVPGPASDDPLFRCLEGEMRERLTDAIENLPEKERLILNLYYYEELTMKEIGATIGVVESRVSQIRTSAVIRLRAALGVTSEPTRAQGGKGSRTGRRQLTEKSSRS